MYNMMYHWGDYYGYANQFGWNAPFHQGWGILFGGAIAILAIWSLIWKGLALWRASHQESKIWFVVLLLVNTAGILDILYLYIFSKESDNWWHRIFKK